MSAFQEAASVLRPRQQLAQLGAAGLTPASKRHLQAKLLYAQALTSTVKHMLPAAPAAAFAIHSYSSMAGPTAHSTSLLIMDIVSLPCQ